MVTYLRWLKLRSRCLTRQELPWLRWSGMDNGHLLEVTEAEVKMFNQTGVTLRWSGMDNGHLLEVTEAEVKMFDQTGVTLTQMVRDGQWSLTWGDWSWGQDVWPDMSTLTQMVRDGQWSLTWGDWSWGQDVWPDRSYPDSDGQGWTMVTYLRWLKLRSRCLTRQELPWLRWSGMDNGHLLEVIEAEVKMFDQTGVTLTQMVRDGQWSLTWGDWSWGQDVWPDRSYPDLDGQGWTMVTYLVIEAEVKMFDQTWVTLTQMVRDGQWSLTWGDWSWGQGVWQTGVTLTQMVRDGQWTLTWGDWSWGQDVWPDMSYLPWLRWSGMDNGHLLEVIEAEVKVFDLPWDRVTLTQMMVTYLRWLKLRSRCLTRQELPWLRWSGMDNGHLLEVIEAEVKMFDQTGVTLTQMVRDNGHLLEEMEWDSDGQGWFNQTGVTLRWLKQVKMFDQTGVTLTQMVRDGQWSLTWGDWSWGQDVWPDRVTMTQMVRDGVTLTRQMDGQWSLTWGDWSWGQDVWPDRSYPDSDGQGWTMVTYLRWLKLRSRCLTRQELPWLRWSGMDNGHLLEVIEAEVKMFDQTWVTLTQMVRDGQWTLTWGDWSWGQDVWPDRSYPDSDGQGWTMVTCLRWLKLRSRCLTRQELPWLRWSGMDNGHLLEVIEAEVKMFDQTGVTLTQMVRDGQWSLTWGDWSWGQDVWPDRSYPDLDGQGWTMVTYLRWLKLRSRCLTRQELPWLRWSGMDNGHLLEVIEAEVKMFDQTGVTLT